MREDKIWELVRLSVGQASLLSGRETARAVDDFEYLNSTDERVVQYENAIETLKEKMSEREIAKCIEITNAPI